MIRAFITFLTAVIEIAGFTRCRVTVIILRGVAVGNTGFSTSSWFVARGTGGHGTDVVVTCPIEPVRNLLRTLIIFLTAVIDIAIYASPCGTIIILRCTATGFAFITNHGIAAGAGGDDTCIVITISV